MTMTKKKNWRNDDSDDLVVDGCFHDVVNLDCDDVEN